MSTIAAILNCYETAGGANRAQVVVRTGGAVEIHGDDTLARHILQQLAAAQLPPPPSHSTEPRFRIPRRPRPDTVPVVASDRSG